MGEGANAFFHRKNVGDHTKPWPDRGTNEGIHEYYNSHTGLH